MKPLFEWDIGNTQKLELVRKSGRLFTIDEVESVFEDPDLIIFSTYIDPVSHEPRYLTVGLCNTGTVLTVTFVVRQGLFVSSMSGKPRVPNSNNIMAKKLSKAVWKGYGVGSPSAAEIRHLEQGAVKQVTLSEIITRSLRKVDPSSNNSE